MTIDSQVRNWGASVMNDPAFRTRVDFNQYLDPTVYPARIRAAAQEAIDRRMLMIEYLNKGNVDYADVLPSLVVDASDAECAVLNLLGVWQSATLAEGTSMLQWMDEVE